MNFGPPRGMRDFYPEDAWKRNRLFSFWREAALLHGFEEYDSPVVETEELLTRKSGEEIVHQIYNFTDKSGRPLALRPEMTPSLARMIIAKQSSLSFPLKWFSIPQCFRYERMTRGRKREHYQWNVDIIGEESVIAEAEVLSTAITAIRKAGLSSSQVKVRVGDRSLLEKLFAASSIPLNKFTAVCLALDKRGKINDEQMTTLLKKEDLADSDVSKVFDLLAIETLDEAADALGGSEHLTQIKALFSMMEHYGLEDYLVFDLSIIRGLDYYTGIVFEAFDTERKFRAIFGGGRYDNLLSSLGGKTVPSVGLGFGDVVICELLDHLGLGLGSRRDLDVYMAFMTEDEKSLVLKGARRLREKGSSVSLQLSPMKPKKIFSSASKLGARFVVLAGPGEREQNVLKVKNLENGAQDMTSPEDLPALLERL